MLMHIQVHQHFIRECVYDNDVDLEYVPTADQVADVLTEGLSTTKHEKFTKEMGVVGVSALSRPASCSRELQYGSCLASGMGHKTEFMIEGTSSTCWLAHQSLWPLDYL